MQFLVTVTVGLPADAAPPTELQTAMTKFVHDETRAGTFMITGGLAPRADGAHSYCKRRAGEKRATPAHPRLRRCGVPCTRRSHGSRIALAATPPGVRTGVGGRVRCSADRHGLPTLSRLGQQPTALPVGQSQ